MNDNEMDHRYRYKVWLEIEEYDTDTEEGRTLDTPGAAIAEFLTYRQATLFAEAVNQLLGMLSETVSGPAASRSASLER